MRKAIGFVETRSLVGALEAADTMSKTASVKVHDFRFVGSGVVSVTVSGDVAAVKAAVENGRQSAEQISEIISANVIPRPHEEVDKIF